MNFASDFFNLKNWFAVVERCELILLDLFDWLMQTWRWGRVKSTRSRDHIYISVDLKIFLLNCWWYCFCLWSCHCSGSDWKYAAEKFVQQLPDKVFVHCKLFCSFLYKVIMIPVSSSLCNPFFPLGSKKNPCPFSMDQPIFLGMQGDFVR